MVSINYRAFTESTKFGDAISLGSFLQCSDEGGYGDFYSLHCLNFPRDFTWSWLLHYLTKLCTELSTPAASESWSHPSGSKNCDSTLGVSYSQQKHKQAAGYLFSRCTTFTPKLEKGQQALCLKFFFLIGTTLAFLIKGHQYKRGMHGVASVSDNKLMTNSRSEALLAKVKSAFGLNWFSTLLSLTFVT